MAERVGQVASLDTLRGMSALAVCWYHFSGSSMIGAGPIRTSGEYGWLGVEVFFVISGFVIPLALLKERYSLSNYRTFMLKRLARLYPPYLASVVVGFALLALYSIYKGQPRVNRTLSRGKESGYGFITRLFLCREGVCGVSPWAKAARALAISPVTVPFKFARTMTAMLSSG
jgi:peptidoglycan/LPS O-acetylase OafA/YrhL